MHIYIYTLIIYIYVYTCAYTYIYTLITYIYIYTFITYIYVYIEREGYIISLYIYILITYIYIHTYTLIMYIFYIHIHIYICICTCSKEKETCFFETDRYFQAICPARWSPHKLEPSQSGKNQATPTPQDGKYGKVIYHNSRLGSDCSIFLGIGKGGKSIVADTRSFILLAFWSSLWTGALTNHGHKMGQVLGSNGLKWVCLKMGYTPNEIAIFHRDNDQ